MLRPAVNHPDGWPSQRDLPSQTSFHWGHGIAWLSMHSHSHSHSGVLVHRNTRKPVLFKIWQWFVRFLFTAQKSVWCQVAKMMTAMASCHSQMLAVNDINLICQLNFLLSDVVQKKLTPCIVIMDLGSDCRDHICSPIFVSGCKYV